MATKAVTIDYSQLEDFVRKVDVAANSEFKKEIKKFMIGLGDEFLRIVDEEIIRRNVVDTRLLLNSFQKGSGDGVWVLKDGGMSLEIGTNVKYASYVNDGHWTNPKGVRQRWVPGYWNGDKFVYSPGAKTGMLLKQKWVEGAHYWEASIRIMERMIPQFLDAKLNDWMKNYFGL